MLLLPVGECHSTMQRHTISNPAVIAALVSRGGEVNAPLPGGRTPLHEAAARNRNPEMITALLAAGAEVNAQGANDEVWSNRESMVAASSKAVRGANPLGRSRYIDGVHRNPDALARGRHGTRGDAADSRRTHRRRG